MPNANTLVVLDFETTGLSPDQGDRAIEIGAVRIVEGEITDSFQALMNPGRRVDSFIEGYTGITNEMLEDAEPCSTVMNRFADYIGDDNLLAHNASFDRRFLDAELERISRDYRGEFACSLLVSRRVFQDAPNHKLGTLIDYTNIPTDGTFHRALFDAEMTAKLWLKIIDAIQQQLPLDEVPFALIKKLCVTPKKNVQKFLLNWKAKAKSI
ncbi:MAG: DNA polymerase III subunit epsilon [Gammaproteobacteria bacterium]|nr:MAG: DNA polymerase III subunit epsilon [Gammaproteobacteria bacterium]